jgi:GNAT superfamily N-acetyltransferase
MDKPARTLVLGRDARPMTIDRVTGHDVRRIAPLLRCYLEAVPDDPWAQVPEDCLAWYEILSAQVGGIVLFGRYGDRPAGFCVGEVLWDDPNRTRMLMVYAAYVAPLYRSRAVRDEALRQLRAFGRRHGAAYLSTLARNRAGLRRWLGPDWKDAGTYDGHGYLVAPIGEE